MLKNTTLVLALFYAIAAYAQRWSLSASFPGIERDDAVGFSINEEGYVGTGVTPGPIFHNDFYRYSPSTNKWEKIPDIIGGGRQYSASIEFENKGCIIGGSLYGGGYTSEMQCYDSETDKWELKAPLPGEGRAAPLGFSLNNKVYAAGGRQNAVVFQDFWAYEPNRNTWIQQANLPFGSRYEMVSFTAGGFAFAGLGKGGSQDCHNDFWRYNPLNEAWQRMADFPGRICTYAIAFSNNGNGFICTGLAENDEVLTEFWKYDVERNTWLQLNPPEFGMLRGVASFVVDNCAYVVTGIDENFDRNKQCWRYCFSSESATEIVIYPNPASSVLSVTINRSVFEGSYEVFTTEGSLVDGGQFSSSSGSFILHVRQYQQGYYILKLMDNIKNQVHFKRLAITH